MTKIIPLVSLILVTSVALAEEVVVDVSWPELASKGKLARVEVLRADKQTSFDHIRIVNPHSYPSTVRVLILEEPGIARATYAVTGRVRYEAVEGEGYLEMWNLFPDGGAYFSRTLAQFGPLKHLAGSSGWRPFVLPFHSEEGMPPPEKLVVNVVLPGRGTVSLGPVRLAQYAPGQDPVQDESAAETIDQISWADAERRLLSLKIHPAGDEVSFERLQVSNPHSHPVTVTVLVLEGPQVTTGTYALRGRLRHKDVEGRGYLEMWSFFPDDSHYFSRTLGERGPTRHLQGSSDWRPFLLPFYSKEIPSAPEKLVFNVVLPGRGTLVFGPAQLAQYGPGEDPLAVPGAWWSDRTGGLLGGLLGSALGCLGALIGVLCSLGKARRLVLGTLKAMVALGAASLLTGLAALARSQPYGVCYPLLLLGVLCVAIPSGLLRTVRRRYDEMELRRMRAMDAQ